jgi:hypothetical protein
LSLCLEKLGMTNGGLSVTGEALEQGPITIRERSLFLVTPALQLFFESDRIVGPVEFPDVNEAKRPERAGVAAGVVAGYVLGVTPLDVVRHAGVERSVDAT